MRTVKHPQSKFGQMNIADIQFNPRSRDDIPAVLKGLQYIYVNHDLREKVFAVLATSLSGDVRQDTGRPGMELWQVFVLGVLKLALGCDYDRLQELANQHNTLRQMLGHSDWEDNHQYALQTLIDNIPKLKIETLVEVNQLVVEAGHELVKKKSCGPILKGRCDSFVVETDVHYPTDTNLLWDALRKLIQEVGRCCEKHGIAGWRQYHFNCRQVKRLFRHSQKIRYSTSKDEVKRAAKNQQVRATYSAYLEAARYYVARAKQTLAGIVAQGDIVSGLLITAWIEDAERQIDQIDRRVLQAQVIPHEEKVFSIFERHTEWISKGKAGVPVELGVRVCVLEDQYQFILHHRVMWQETDDKVTVLMVEQAKQRYPSLAQCSFDKGFYTQANQLALAKILDHVTLPKKGRWSAADKARESSDTFRQARIQHPAIESCINNLEQRGLDRCRSRGRNGFESYVALSIVACNLHRIGLVLQRREKAKLERAARKRKKLAA